MRPSANRTVRPVTFMGGVELEFAWLAAFVRQRGVPRDLWGVPRYVVDPPCSGVRKCVSVRNVGFYVQNWRSIEKIHSDDMQPAAVNSDQLNGGEPDRIRAIG